MNQRNASSSLTGVPPAALLVKPRKIGFPGPVEPILDEPDKVANEFVLGPEMIM